MFMDKKDIKEIVNSIRTGDLDINVQDLFLSKMIKGLLYNLNNDIKVRGICVPHYIMHTGDDRMFIEARGYDFSIEPALVSNEKHTIYDIIPKCIVNTTGITLDTGQLTSPYSIGGIQYENENGIYMLKGEFRRMPVTLSVDLKYYTDSYTDMLELIQYVLSNLAFIRTYDIMYMGQKIKCSYKIPDSFSDEHTMDLDGTYTDSREHTMSLSIEVEGNMPIFNNKTIMSATDIITNVRDGINIYPKNNINDNIDKNILTIYSGINSSK